jgi:hypothetical protein
MSFRLGDALDKYGVTYQQLARYTGRAKQTVYTDAYITGVTNKFKAMGYAYALQCDINQILERKDPIKIEGWEQPCLPNCE